MVVCPANILFFITVNTLLKNINLEFYFTIYMYDCLHISRYGCTQGVCVCFGGGKYVYIYIYMGMCIYGYRGSDHSKSKKAKGSSVVSS